MRHRVIVPESLYSEALQHLLPESGDEGLIFFLAGKSMGESWLTLTVRDLLIPSEEDFDNRGYHGIELTDDAKVRFILKARSEGLCLIEAHSHPFVRSSVTFSTYDWENAREFVPYIHLKLKERPYAALVFGQQSVDGFVWCPGYLEPDPLDELLIVGPRMNKLYPTSSSSKSDSRLDLERFDRQLKAFGREGQTTLEGLRIGIVGAGGVGSLVGQQLAYLGVKTFTLVDDDTVEVTNLNRLVGAIPSDISNPKVATLARLIQTVSSTANVGTICANVRESRAIQALKDVDAIFGCTDGDSSRLILNELATSCGVPYIDTATGIESIGGKVHEAGGRVVIVVPGFPCLLCSQEIDFKEAHDELTSPAELEFRKARGYASEKVDAPSVISLNSTISSLAVTEFLAMATGIKETVPCLYYYALRTSLKIRRSLKNPNCLSCNSAGKGDHVTVERYSWQELPKDLPI
jgi:molybdopterin/thiamine biosynthesis adenylyltransferase